MAARLTLPEHPLDPRRGPPYERADVVEAQALMEELLTQARGERPRERADTVEYLRVMNEWLESAAEGRARQWPWTSRAEVVNRRVEFMQADGNVHELHMRGIVRDVARSTCYVPLPRVPRETLVGHVAIYWVAHEDADGMIVVPLNPRMVAIKTYIMRLVRTRTTRQGIAIMEDAISELMLMQKLNGDHLNVVRLSCVLQTAGPNPDEDCLFAVMPYYAGGDLFEFIADHPRTPMPEVHAKGVIRGLVEGLAFMHARGVAHRDISPENVMLDANHRLAILVDLGCACSIVPVRPGEPLAPNAGLVPHTGSIGKLKYMAPEVFAFTPATAPQPYVYDATKADVWSLGVTLFCLLTSVPPYGPPPSNENGTFRAVSSGRVPDLFRVWKQNVPFTFDLTPQALAFLNRMLAFDPRARPAAWELLLFPFWAYAF